MNVIFYLNQTNPSSRTYFPRLRTNKMPFASVHSQVRTHRQVAPHWDRQKMQMLARHHARAVARQPALRQHAHLLGPLSGRHRALLFAPSVGHEAMDELLGEDKVEACVGCGE